MAAEEDDLRFEEEQDAPWLGAIQAVEGGLEAGQRQRQVQTGRDRGTGRCGEQRRGRGRGGWGEEKRWEAGIY